MVQKLIKTGKHSYEKLIDRTRARICGLSARKKIMIASMLLIFASYYSAPFGVLLLSGSLIAEWRKKPAGFVTFREIIKNSTFFIPAVILMISAVTGPLVYHHYASVGLVFLVLLPILFCAFSIEFLWGKEDALHMARYAAFLIPVSVVLGFFLSWFGIVFPIRNGELRIASTFSNPNYYSYVLEIVLIFLCALYYHVWIRSSRNWLMISFALSIAGLYFTGSRTGMLAFLAGITVFYLCMSEKIILVFVFGSITLFLVLAAALPELAVSIFRDLIPRPETFLSEIGNRFTLWNVALQQIAKDPIFGTGLDSYRLLIPKDAPSVLRSSMHCHNIFINFWLETGFFGVASLVWILIRTVSGAVRQLSSSNVRPYLAAGVGMITATAVHGIMDAPLVSSQTLALFGIFLGCTAAAASSKKTRI